MTIPYKWICSDCATPNEACTDTCKKCGCPAIVSVADIEKRKLEPLPPALPERQATTAQKIVGWICVPVVVIGAFLERPSAPTTTLWWVAVSMIVCGALPIWIVYQKSAGNAENERPS